jgi:hypothetical protein
MQICVYMKKGITFAETKTHHTMKKVSVINYIGSSKERGVKAFENRVAKILSANGIEGEIIVHNAWMTRRGTGAYTDHIELEVEGLQFEWSRNHNDSMRWDFFYPEAKNTRDLFEAVLTSEIEDIVEFLLNPCEA